MLYNLIMACMQQGIDLRWGALLSYCQSDDEVADAVGTCEFYGVAISDKPDIRNIPVKRPVYNGIWP